MAAPVPASLIDRYMALSDSQRMKFDSLYQAEAKSPDVGFICAFFGVFYLYMGKIGLGVAQIASCLVGVGFVWVIITLFKAKKEVVAHNEVVGQRILLSVQ